MASRVFSSEMVNCRTDKTQRIDPATVKFPFVDIFCILLGVKYFPPSLMAVHDIRFVLVTSLTVFLAFPFSAILLFSVSWAAILPLARISGKYGHRFAMV